MSGSAAGAPVAPTAVVKLPRQVKLFGAVSLLNDFASEMIYPLLPALVTGVLGAGPQALGALDGAADFAAAFVKLGAGRLADRPARRGRLVVLGYAVAVLVRPVIALDRKSTRLNSSHSQISYAVFCLKKKNNR